MKSSRRGLGVWKSPRQRRRERRKGHQIHWMTNLNAAERIRAPFGGCARQLVARVVAEWLSDVDAVLEVGAGSGQLRRWLPEDAGSTWVYTEPDEAALRAFRERFPGAEARSGRVENLPSGDGELDAVVGLCLLDIVSDLPGAMAEMRRVLKPGGKLVHLLDLSPYRAVHFTELAREKKLAFPNLFGDALELPWPKDLLVTDQGPMQALLDALRRLDHPLPRVFQRYFAAAFANDCDGDRLCTEFDVISRTDAMRTLLRESLRSAYQIGFELKLAPPVGTQTSSGEHLAERLRRAAVDAGFVVEVNELWSAWSHEPTTDAEIRQRSFALGQGRTQRRAVAPQLCPDATAPDDAHELTEIGMMVFVAKAASVSGA